MLYCITYTNSKGSGVDVRVGVNVTVGDEVDEDVENGVLVEVGFNVGDIVDEGMLVCPTTGRLVSLPE